ncbi:MAG: sigma-E factor regulatory protein RseB domain-containing protein [Planctomycetota bacterium]
MTLRHLGLALSVLALLAASCLRGSADAAATSFAAAAQSNPGILQRMAAAPTTTRFAGERQLWMRAETNQTAPVLAYGERIYADGLGGFTIEPIAVTQPQLAQGQQDLFEILQRAREGYLFRYRDFAVRDVDLLQQNYIVHDLGTTVTVAGRACQELRFERRLQPSRVYHVAVDQATGLVLRYEQQDSPGVAAMRMEYTSFDPAPNLTGITMHADLASIPLDPNLDNKSTLGFSLRLPNVLHGFQLVDANQITFDNRTWARVQYQDGVEPLLYLYSRRNVLPNGPVTIPDGPEGQPSIRVYSAGSWTVAECQHFGSVFVVAGKLDESRLIETLQSAVE